MDLGMGEGVRVARGITGGQAMHHTQGLFVTSRGADEALRRIVKCVESVTFRSAARLVLCRQASRGLLPGDDGRASHHIRRGNHRNHVTTGGSTGAAERRVEELCIAPHHLTHRVRWEQIPLAMCSLSLLPTLRGSKTHCCLRLRLRIDSRFVTRTSLAKPRDDL